MSSFMIAVGTILSIFVGFKNASLWWLLATALLYFFPVALQKYDQIMWLLEREKVGKVTFMFVYMYFASIFGMVVNYGIGYAVSWLFN